MLVIAAGVSFEDRQDLLGHKSGRITTHYSTAELSKLIEAANKIVNINSSGPTLTLLRQIAASPHKIPTKDFSKGETESRLVSNL